MINVANIAPGDEIRISTKWAMPLSVVAGRATLRIPQTVGDIYGRSHLPESDELLIGGKCQPVMLSVRASSHVEVLGAHLVGGHAKITSAEPIDIVTELWAPIPIIGTDASGAPVALTLTPQARGEQSLNLAVLVDHSGSMAESFGHEDDMSAHEAARQGIVALAAELNQDDFIEVWEFDTRVNRVGEAANGSAGALIKLASALSGPSGGTEIGHAIAAVLAQSQARDILLLTDGLSHELDVEQLSRSGQRISVILIGQDSLEANIGHLAAITGGDIFIATASDLSAVMAAAIEGLRRSHTPLPRIAKMPDRLACIRNNVAIEATWSAKLADTLSPEFEPAAVAVATSLIVNSGTPELASEAALAAGIVSHLTSLVLVDEAGAAQDTLPAMRKVALPVQRHFSKISRSVPSPRCIAPPSPGTSLANELSERIMFQLEADDIFMPVGSNRRDQMARLKDNAHAIDWYSSAAALACADLSALSSSVITIIVTISAIKAVADFAKRNGISPELVAIGVLARALASQDRYAKRVWKSIRAQLKGSSDAEIAALEEQVLVVS
jgi:hypothetical protein